MSNHDLYVLVSYLLIKIKFSLLTQVYIDLFRSECELSSSVYRAEELHSMSKLSIMPDLILSDEGIIQSSYRIYLLF